MRVLLGSGGIRTEERRDLLTSEMQRHFEGADKLLFIPYALADLDGYVAAIHDRNLTGGFSIDPIHRYADPIDAVRHAEGVFVGGGSTFRLLAALYQHQLIDPIRERVAEGMPYLGISAGTNVACPTIQTTNDMPIVMPPSFSALALVPFQVNAHYFFGQTHVKTDGGYIEHFGETRDDRLREYHEMNDRPVIGLYEGGFLRVHDRRVELVGTPAKLFFKGQPAREIAPGAVFDASTFESIP